MVSSVIRVYFLGLYFRGCLAYRMSERSLLYCQSSVIAERSLFDGIITSLLDMTTSLLQFHALYSYLVRITIIWDEADTNVFYFQITDYGNLIALLYITKYVYQYDYNLISKYSWSIAGVFVPSFWLLRL